MKLLKLRKYFLLLIIVLTISLSLVCIIKKNTTNTTISNKVEKLTKNDIYEEGNLINDISIKSVYVDVKGSVKAPGVYKLTNEKIVMDAINSAGGLEDYADTTYINLSKKLVDEMVIYIFSKDEVNSLIDIGEITKEKNRSIGGVLNNDAYLESNTKENTKNNNGINSTTSTNDSIKDEKIKQNTIININTASKEELMNLSGIGESKAQNIINYRVDNGNFKTIEEIKNVNGIGESIFEKIKNDICI